MHGGPGLKPQHGKKKKNHLLEKKSHLYKIQIQEQAKIILIIEISHVYLLGEK
jgi:hypothetical protein